MVQSWNWPGVYWTLRSVVMQRGLVVPHLRAPDVRAIQWHALRARGCRGVVFDKDNTLTAPYAPSLFSTLAVRPPASSTTLCCVGKCQERKQVSLHRPAVLPPRVLWRHRLSGASFTKRVHLTAWTALCSQLVASQASDCHSFYVRAHPHVQDAMRQCVEVFGRDGLVVFSNSAGSSDDPGHEEARRIEHSLGLPVLRHAHKKPRGFDSVMEHFAAVQRRGGDAPPAGPVTSPSQLAMVGDRFFTDILFGNLHGMLTIHTSCLTTSGDTPVVKAVRRR